MTAAARIGKRAVKAPKLTHWYPPTVSPFRVGVYQVRMHYASGGMSSADFCKWDGGGWRNCRQTVDQAATDSSRGIQSKSWRGLAADPSKAVGK